MGRPTLSCNPRLVVALAGILLLMAGQATAADASRGEPPVAGAPVGAPKTDPLSGLIIDDGWELVRGHCAACHSARLVTQSRGSRDTWESMIRWMQETQGLWPFDVETETIILDYLARNYAPAEQYRRQPLPPELSPANPYDRNGSP
jgi:hypothetical protein